MNYVSTHTKKTDIVSVILLSLLFHFIIISGSIFLTSRFSTRPHKKYTFYEVNLVELSKKKPGKKAKKNISHTKKIVFRKKERVVVIPKKKIRSRRRRKNADKIIEEAISKIRKRTERKERDRIEEIISKIKEKIGKEERKKGFSPSYAVIEGLTLTIYKEQIKSRIKNNWIYPLALVSPKKKNLEATIILKVKKSGEIIRFWFKKKSNDAIFNDSLIKAIERSNPLPPFPEGYKKRYEEIEIHFSLSELVAS